MAGFDIGQFLTKVKEPSLAYYLPIARRRKSNEFIPFQRGLA